MKYIKNDGGRKKDYPNSKGKVGDCVVRAISICLEKSYKKVLSDLCEKAIEVGQMPNSHDVYREYLKDNGWEEIKFGKKIVRISSTHIPKDEWVICYMSNHLTAIKGNELHDIWNCGFTYNPQGKKVDKRVFRIYRKNKEKNIENININYI